MTPPRAGSPGKAVAVVARGMTSARAEALEHPVHPARMKNDCVRQVSWLAGQRLSGRLLRTDGPNGVVAGWLAAYSCRGSPGLSPEFPFDPLAGNLSRRAPYSGFSGSARAVLRLFLA